MSPREVIDIGYRPRPQQAEIHRSLKRFNVFVCHRRFGKTVLCIAELIDKALRCDKERPRFAYIAPLYRQAKQSAWDYLKAYTLKIPGCQAYESELRIDFQNGARIQLFGADNPDALRGIYLDGVVLDEYAQMPSKLWGEVIRPALSDRMGWAIFIGTPMGRNAFCDLYEYASAENDWFSAMFKASQTGIIPADELKAAREQMGSDQYAQEFECSFTAAIIGAYYGALINKAETDGMIGTVPWEPKLEVVTSWDLGFNDTTAIWFAQLFKGEIRLIDFYEASGVGLDHYVRMMRDRPYVYAREQILPHDADVHSLNDGKSRKETLAGLGVKCRVLPIKGVDDGINEVRMLLPKCRFDKEKCSQGIEALRQYRKEWDDKRKTFRENPLHDWSSNAADAFRYLAMGLRDQGVTQKPIVYPKQHVSHGVI